MEVMLGLGLLGKKSFTDEFVVIWTFNLPLTNKILTFASSPSAGPTL